MSGLHLQKQHVLLETVSVQHLEKGRILNLVLSEGNDFARASSLMNMTIPTECALSILFNHRTA
jgi:hypothetical protein